MGEFFADLAGSMLTAEAAAAGIGWLLVGACVWAVYNGKLVPSRYIDILTKTIENFEEAEKIRKSHREEEITEVKKNVIEQGATLQKFMATVLDSSPDDLSSSTLKPSKASQNPPSVPFVSDEN